MGVCGSYGEELVQCGLLKLPHIFFSEGDSIFSQSFRWKAGFGKCIKQVYYLSFLSHWWRGVVGGVASSEWRRSKAAARCKDELGWVEAAACCEISYRLDRWNRLLTGVWRFRET